MTSATRLFISAIALIFSTNVLAQETPAKEEAAAEPVKIEFKNNASEVEAAEKSAEDADKAAKESQKQAHEKLKESAQKKLDALKKRLDLERENIKALDEQLKQKKIDYRKSVAELTKSKCRIDDYQKGEFIHLTPSLVCLQRNQVSVEYGPQYYLFSQSGDLGGITSDLASASQLKGSYHRGLTNNMGAEASLGLRALPLNTEETTSATRYLFDLGVDVYYKKYFVGLHLNQLPAVRFKATDEVEWGEVGTIELLFGYRHITSPIYIFGDYAYSHFKVFVGLPVSQMSSGDLTATELSGFSLLAEGITTRPFLKDNMRLGLSYFLKFHSLDFQADWNGNTGAVTQSHTQIGLNLFFQYDFI